MACIDKLREELMDNLGIAVERSSSPPSVANHAGDVLGSARREILHGRISHGGNRSSRGMVEYPQNPRRLQRPLTQQQQDELGGRRSSSIHDRRIDAKYARPGSAKLRATSNGRGGVGRRARPASASSTARSLDNIKSSEMDILLEICKDQGRGFSLDPSKFDSSVSAICNLPVGPFVGAASAGWGTYFRDLHRKMRARERAAPTQEKSHIGTRRTSATHSRRRLGPLQTTVKCCRDSSGGDSKPPGQTHNRRRREDFDGLAASRARAAKSAAEEDVTNRMVIRLQTLWLELKIPEPDRAYIVATYLDPGCGEGVEGGNCGLGGSGEKRGGGGTSTAVQRELARQIALLLEYRTATIEVLHSVKIREGRLSEVEHALASFQWHRGLDTDAVGLVAALADLRDASLGVVRSVKEWRRNLWQPRAFCWRGENYLEKMSRDTGFLRSPVGRGLLSSVGLEASDMTFVIFPSADSDSTCSSESHGPAAADTTDDFRPPPSIVRLTPKAELVAEYRARFFAQAPATEAAGEGSDKDADGSRIPGTGATSRDVELVVQERALQRRVRTERARLATKGCFVPLLRWLPGDRNAPRDRRRSSYSDRRKGSHDTREGVGDLGRGGGGGGGGGGGVAEMPTVKSSKIPTPPPPTTKIAPAVSEDTVVDARQLGDGGTQPDGRCGAIARSTEGGAYGVLLPAVGGDQGMHKPEGGQVHESVATSSREKHEEEEEEEEEEGGGEGEEEQRDLAGRKQQLQPIFEGGDSRLEPNNSSRYAGRGGNNERRAPQTKSADMVPIDSRTELRRLPEAEKSSQDSATGGQGSASNMDDNGTSMREMEGGGPGDEEVKTLGQATRVSEDVPLMEQGNESEAPTAASYTTHTARPPKEEERLRRREDGSPPMATSTIIIAGEGLDQPDGELSIFVKPISTGDTSDNKKKVGETELGYQSCDSVSRGGGYADVEETTQAPGTPASRKDCEESVVGSAYYDDDFEDDGQEFSLSESKAGSGSTTPAPCSDASGTEATQTTTADFVTDATIIATLDENRSQVDVSAAALVVQSAWRRTVAVGNAQMERRRRRQREDKEDAAATRIQQAARAALDDKARYHHRRRIDEQEGAVNSEQQDDSAEKLRSWLVEWRTKRDPQVHQTPADAAVRIQSAVRRKRASDAAREFRRDQEARKIDAAVVIQATARGRQQRALARRREEAQARRVEKSQQAVMNRESSSEIREARPNLASAEREETRRRQRSASEASPAESGETSRQTADKQEIFESKTAAAITSSEGHATRDSSPAVESDNHRSSSLISRKSSSTLTCAGLTSTSGTGTTSSSTGSGSGSYSSSGESSSLDGVSLSDSSSAESDSPSCTKQRHQKAPPDERTTAVSGEVESPGVEMTTAERTERTRGGVGGDAGVERSGGLNVRQPDDGLGGAGDESPPSLHSIDGAPASEAREGGEAKAEADACNIMCDVGISSSFVGLVPVPEEKLLLGAMARSGSEYCNSDDFEFDALSSASAASPRAVDAGGEASTHGAQTAARVATKGGTDGDEGGVAVPEGGEAGRGDGGGSYSEGSMLTLSVTSSD